MQYDLYISHYQVNIVKLTHRKQQVNITCILLIPTTSDRWMKAFRNMPYSCFGPNSEEINIFLKDDFLFVSPPQWLLPHPECCSIYNLYNDTLYKIEKLSFTKDSLEKEGKKYQIFWVLQRKTLSSMNFQTIAYIIVNFFFSSHSKFTCIYNT